jgi:hypothetical protein
MLVQHGPTPEISITFDPSTLSYGFSTRLPSLRPHWTIDTFASLEEVMRWVDPWTERVWEEADDMWNARTAPCVSSVRGHQPTRSAASVKI